MTSKPATTPDTTKPVKAAAKAASPSARKTSRPIADKAKDAPVAAETAKPGAPKPVAAKASSAAATRPAAVAAPSAADAARTAETKSVVAALLAARKKTAAAAAPSGKAARVEQNVKQDAGSVKGEVEVTDKTIKKTVVANEAVQSTPVAAAAPRPGVGGHMAPGLRRPGAPAAAVAKGGKPMPKGQGFKTNEFIVYPAHGVGEIIAIEQQEVAGYKLELFVISFVKDKMILKVPLPKIASVGMRKLAEPPVVKRALDTLTGRARVKRTMWSRRAQEYEAKINSGDLVSIAEVVRDLYRSDAQPEQSYSERQLYEAALDRMAREISAVQELTDTEALKVIDDQLQKGPRRGKVEDAEADETDDGDDIESNVGEAA